MEVRQDADLPLKGGFGVRSQPFYCGSRSWHELHPTSGNRSGFRGWLSGFRPRQLAGPSRKPAVASPAIAVLLASRATRWFPLMPDNLWSISGRSSWLRGLSEHKCDAAYTMGAGLQCCKACTQLAALAFRASAPVTKPAAANCSNKRARFGASECPHPRLARHEWRSTRPAPPLFKQRVVFESLGSTPVSVSRVSIGPVESPPVSVLVSFATVQ